MRLIEKEVSFLQISLNNRGIFEIETNGTITPTDELNKLIKHYTISPKSSNSGMNISKRLKEDALLWFASKENSYFKFVISNKEDLEEIQTSIIKKFNIKPQNIYLMPACNSRKELVEKLPLIATLCKQNNYQLSSRLQLSIWDQATGV